MRRPITQVGQSVYEWLFTRPAQDAMVAVSKLAAACFGTAGIVNGLACAPTSPATMAVQIAPGEIYQLANLENTICGTLPANTTNQIVKQGIQLNAFTSALLTAPSTTGFSQNYLIQAQYADSDISVDPTTGNSPVVLQFYNSSNPQQPYSGPNNTGQTSNTFRDGVVSLQVVAGIAAATGSQQTPSVSTGWIGLAVITVANGQSSITAANITSLVTNTLPAGLLQAIQSNQLTYAIDTGTANAYAIALQPAPTTLVDGMIVSFQAAHANTGASTLNINGLGAKAILGGAHSALQGGEIIVGSKVEVVWHATLSSFVLLEQTGGATQIAPATQSEHAMQLGQAVGRLLNVQIFKTSGTYTPTGGTNNIRVRAVGGGGAGGGTQATSSSQAAVAGGGASGMYAEVWMANPGMQTVTIGAAGVAAAGAAGGNGGSTSLGALIVLTGGSGAALGGAGTPPNLAPSAAAGSTGSTLPTNGVINFNSGTSAAPGISISTAQAIGGGGGSNPFGNGQQRGIEQAGQVGAGFGSGGSGAGMPASSAATAGGNGNPGILIIEEYA